MIRETSQKKRRITKSYYNSFVERNKLFLYKVSSIGISASQELEENIAIAYEQLLYAMIYFDHKKFPQERKGSFTSFLYNRINGKSRHSMKKNRRFSNLEIVDNITSNKKLEYNSKAELIFFLNEILASLPIEEKTAVAYYLQNMTLAEIGEKMKISPCKADNLKKRGLEKLRKFV